ncbi:hypothetical protein BDV98DRAFT_651590 [Pterulicium gracile]|uniref:Peptide hydrolase n=1 Tax=Pterulicium gracile TaxID=1884261 RepID=A0A5C3Q702_9AGAR|nr:hypothetical protein BDV98DRAFT_651590 [Pterula gracilis]
MRAGVLLVPALAATSVAALPQTGSSKIAGIDLGAIFDPPSWWWLPNILKARLTSKAYQKVITTNGLLQHSKALMKFSAIDGNNHRAFGTPGYNASVDYVERWAKSYGYDVYRQTVTYPAYYVHGQGLTVAGQVYPEEVVVPAQYSGTTGPEGTTGSLFAVANLGCVAADYEGAAGTVALIQRGECNFALKGSLAKEAGALGAIVWNNADGPPVLMGLEANGEHPAMVAITLADGQVLADRLAAGEELETTLLVDVTFEFRPADNVIAQSKWGDKNNVVFVGAHLDSVPAGPGINDDGSGTAALARYKSSKNAVRFAWWATEEVGLVGSRHYVEQLSQAEKDKIALYINLDMLASPNYIIGIHDADNSGGQNSGIPAPAGSNTLERLSQEYFANRGLNWTGTAFTAGSDYRGFLDAGIVAGGFATGAGALKTEREVELFGGEAGVPHDICYHLACDTIDNLALDGKHSPSIITFLTSSCCSL